jgi:hypothetical protein
MMRNRFLLLALLSALGLTAVAISADAPPAAENHKIAKLVDQLASPMFMEREAATKALNAIGAPALEALRKAASAGEPEARRRAGELIVRIERRLQTEALLKPTTVHLVCEDMPVAKAVAELAKKSGYSITLSGDASKYRNRKVTLDTGETTFWQALDLLCDKAGLREADSIDLPLQPGEPVMKARVIQNGQIQDFEGRRATGQASATPIVLTDGKWRDYPVHYAGAARIRSLPPGTQLSGQHKGKGEILFGIGVVLEPRVGLEKVSGLRIDKALDDQGQDLPQTMGAEPPAPAVQPVWIMNGAVMPSAQVAIGPQQVAVRLKAGAQPSKSIKQLTGCVLADVRTPPEPIMTVDDILKATGKIAKGKDSGSLTVLEVAKQDNGQIRVRVDLVPPDNNNGAGPGRVRLGGIQVMPALPAVLIVPLPRPKPGAQGQGQMQVQIQIQRAGAAAAPLVIGNADPTMGLSLVDDKGRAFQLVNVPRRLAKVANNVVTQELTLVFKPQDGQGEAAKLHYSTTRQVSIELPFTLKDLPLP